MKNHRWVNVVEATPPARTTVIVCQTGDAPRIFAGWLDGGSWHCHLPEHPGGGPAFTADMGDMRTTDFWLTLPEYPADWNVVRTMEYPA